MGRWQHKDSPEKWYFGIVPLGTQRLVFITPFSALKRIAKIRIIHRKAKAGHNHSDNPFRQEKHGIIPRHFCSQSKDSQNPILSKSPKTAKTMRLRKERQNLLSIACYKIAPARDDWQEQSDLTIFAPFSPLLQYKSSFLFIFRCALPWFVLWPFQPLDPMLVWAPLFLLQSFVMPNQPASIFHSFPGYSASALRSGIVQ